MTKPTQTIPLDQYGLPARRLELPEELFEELDRSWDAFVQQRAVTLAQQAHPEPVRPEMPNKPDRTMTIVRLWKRWWDIEDAPNFHAARQGGWTGWSETIKHYLASDDGWSPTMFTLATSLMCVAGVSLLFVDPDESGFWLMSLPINPLWWAMLIDGWKRKDRWWVTVPLLATVTWMLLVYGWPCESHSWHRRGYHFASDVERNLYFASVFLLFLPTRLAWFWKKDTYEAELRAFQEAKERWNNVIDAHAQAYEAERVRQRERVAADPSEMLAFLNEGRATLWREHLNAWTQRIEQIARTIMEGRQYLEWLQRRDAQDSLTARKDALHLDLQRLEAEREEIVTQQTLVVRSREALEHVAMEIWRKLDILDEDQMIEAWRNRLR